MDRRRLLLNLALHAARGTELSVGVDVNAADVVLVPDVMLLRVAIRVVDDGETGGGPYDFARREGVNVAPCLSGGRRLRGESSGRRAHWRESWYKKPVVKHESEVAKTVAKISTTAETDHEQEISFPVNLGRTQEI